jgi:hypothetical protein
MNRAVFVVFLWGAMISAPAFPGEPPVSDPSLIRAPAVRSFGTLPDGREAHLYTLAVPVGRSAAA